MEKREVSVFLQHLKRNMFIAEWTLCSTSPKTWILEPNPTIYEDYDF
jgi:hypothetical protein